MEKLRILQLISSGGFFGAESVVLQLSLQLQALGHEVHVGVFNNAHRSNVQMADAARAHGLPTRVFDCAGPIDWRAVRAIADFVRQRDIQIVHGHGYKSNIYALLSNLLTQRRLVSTCHNWINASAKMRAYAFLDRLVLKRFDAVVPVSDTVRDALLASGFARAKLSLIENGIRPEDYWPPVRRADMRAAFGYRDDDFVVGTVARLSKEKGLDILIRAIAAARARQSRLRLLIVGDGELRGELEAQASALGVAALVQFAGRRNDVAQVLSAFDAFALPSYVEAQPMALLEAMSAGVPAIASTVGDVPKILAQGRHGWLIAPGDVDGLCKAMLECVADAARARTQADAAREDIVNHRSSRSMAQRYAGLYQELLTGKGIA